ncbi:MAG: hypothetical protein E5299_00487 [Burkholderia gladioli]|nr:MAG: hypothetical protein E5299_00487 [Burkholderia gladioli]
MRHYTTLYRQTKTLNVELPILFDNEPIHLVVDSTGLKVYGEGEWKVRQHGYSKRSTWRKVHLALNPNTGKLHAALMTHQHVADGDALAKWLNQIQCEEQINVIVGDGDYDTKLCHAAIAARSAVSSIPPREDAAHLPADTPGAAWHNGAVDAIVRDSCRAWKKDSGYHRRSFAENAMYRFKSLTGNCLWARNIATQANEVSVRVGLINPHGGGGPRSSASRSYRLKLPVDALRPLARFMQQRFLWHRRRAGTQPAESRLFSSHFAPRSGDPVP